jgi:hypothetical protein
MENLQNKIDELQKYIDNQNAGIKLLKKEVRQMEAKLSKNIVDAWEPDLENTKSVVILEDFDGIKHNKWDDLTDIFLTIESLLFNYKTLKK